MVQPSANLKGSTVELMQERACLQAWSWECRSNGLQGPPAKSWLISPDIVLFGSAGIDDSVQCPYIRGRCTKRKFILIARQSRL